MKRGIFLAFAAYALSLLSPHAACPAPSKSLLEKGIAEYHAENYDEALELFKKVLRRDPSSAQALLYLGATYKQMGQYRDAAGVYRAAAALDPPVRDAYPELIETLYMLNQLDEAKQWLARAEKAGPVSGRVAYFKGLILAKEGKSAEAIASFERAKALDGALVQIGDYQIAVLHATERRWSEAKKRLRAVIAVDPATAAASYAREYEAALSRSLAAYKPWQLSISAAYQYDDNVVLEPSAFISPNYQESVRRGGGTGDSALVNSVKIAYEPLLEGAWSLSAHYGLDSTVYREINELTYLSQSIFLTPGYAFERGAVSLSAGYYYSWLHEREYMGVLSLLPTVSVIVAPRHIVQFGFGYSKRDLRPQTAPDDNRDADLYTVSLGYLYQFAKERGLASLRYEYAVEDAEGNNWENLGNRIGVSMLLPLAEKVSVTTAGEVLWQDYRNIDSATLSGAEGFPGTPTKRKDRIYSGSAGVDWKPSKGLTVRVQYSYTRDDSNFTIYDFERNQYTAGLEYVF
ncbi:MAG: tetratricopeptide repeat protein [Nitrospirota bacterium]